MKKQSKNLDTTLQSFKPKVKEESGVLYAYVKESNKKYLLNKAVLANLSLSQFMDQLIDDLRSKRVI